MIVYRTAVIDYRTAVIDYRTAAPRGGRGHWRCLVDLKLHIKTIVILSVTINTYAKHDKCVRQHRHSTDGSLQLFHQPSNVTSACTCIDPRAH